MLIIINDVLIKYRQVKYKLNEVVITLMVEYCDDENVVNFVLQVLFSKSHKYG